MRDNVSTDILVSCTHDCFICARHIVLQIQLNKKVIKRVVIKFEQKNAILNLKSS